MPGQLEVATAELVELLLGQVLAVGAANGKVRRPCGEPSRLIMEPYLVPHLR